MKSLDKVETMEYILGMKKGILKLFSVLFVVAAVYAGAFLDYFHGRSEGEDIRLEWRTSEEVNLRHFIIERKTPQSPFIELATIEPLGSNSFYTYLDDSAYKIDGLTFYRRIHLNRCRKNYYQEVL